MPRLLLSVVVAATTMLVSMSAMAGNQEKADQIAKKIQNSGKMSDFHIAVKYKDGTVWLKGQVASEEQMSTALKLVYNTTGVSRVVNALAVAKPDREPVVAQEQQLSMDREIPISMEREVPRNNKQSFVRQASALEPNMLPQQRLVYEPAQPVGRQSPMPVAMAQMGPVGGMPMAPRPMYTAAAQGGVAPARYDQPCMPNYAWPSYAAYPNYAAVTYPRQYSPTAWPYIGPFYPYPQVPLGWRKVTLEWKDGWWFLDFKDEPPSCFR
jgi:hypothetical protein